LEPQDIEKLPVVHKLKEWNASAVAEVLEFRGEITVVVPKEQIFAVAQYLATEPALRFSLLSDITTVDNFPLEPRFEVLYHLVSIDRRDRIRLKVRLAGKDPSIASVTPVWPTANWHERESFDRPETHLDARRLGGLSPSEGLSDRRLPVTGIGEHATMSTSIETPIGTQQTMVLNMGPQHPSTHGVLRVMLELDGETVVKAESVIGYLHTGIEKSLESKTYSQGITLTDRVDYLAPLSNNLGYCLAVEKILGIEVPKRAQYIRVLLAELTRCASHLVWLGTHAIDLGAMTVFLYSFREREEILKIFEYLSGQRMMTSYFRIGGLALEPPSDWLERVQRVVDYLPAHIDEYETLLTKNKIWLARTVGVGNLSANDAIAWGCTGPLLRASGVAYDVRKAFPYSSYDEFDFNVQTQTAGDCYARYQVRVAEIRESLKIVKQAMARIPADGPFRAEIPGIIPPSREEMKASIEGLIYHFKIFTEGFTPPVGEVYQAIESPRGELGYFIRSDGSHKPYRVKMRTPSFVNLQILPELAIGRLISDVVACIGTTDIVLGEVDR
jgi:NADH-quinone oxidoreductase subunit D